MREKVNQMTDDLKFDIVQEYLRGDLSQRSLMLKYNFGGKQSINNWMRKFGVSNSNTKESMAKQQTVIDRNELLSLKIKKLEEDLKLEQFRTKALNTMIDIAERELKVDIRKKAGAKR